MKFILFISKKQSVYHLFAKYPDNTSIFHKDYPAQNLLDLQIARNGLCGAFWISVVRIAGTARNRVLAVCSRERGGFAVVMKIACLCAYGWGNMPRSSRCIHQQ